ncbi:MAG: hypothetical protein ACK5WX_00945, partial [bacterium]
MPDSGTQPPRPFGFTALPYRAAPIALLAILLGAVLLWTPEASAAQSVAAAAPAARESDAAVISTGVATVTGLAISPLVVLVALGWHDFIRAGGFAAAPGALPL